ncbi:hypothetical protein Brsp05_04488 [Brucella sp. NBRC 12953]
MNGARAIHGSEQPERRRAGEVNIAFWAAEIVVGTDLQDTALDIGATGIFIVAGKRCHQAVLNHLAGAGNNPAYDNILSGKLEGAVVGDRAIDAAGGRIVFADLQCTGIDGCAPGHFVGSGQDQRAGAILDQLPAAIVAAGIARCVAAVEGQGAQILHVTDNAARRSTIADLNIAGNACKTGIGVVAGQRDLPAALSIQGERSAAIDHPGQRGVHIILALLKSAAPQQMNRARHIKGGAKDDLAAA